MSTGNEADATANLAGNNGIGRFRAIVKHASGGADGGNDASWLRPDISMEDEAVLRRLGKTPVLKVFVPAIAAWPLSSTDNEQRNFGFVSILGYVHTRWHGKKAFIAA